MVGYLKTGQNNIGKILVKYGTIPPKHILDVGCYNCIENLAMIFSYKNYNESKYQI